MNDAIRLTPKPTAQEKHRREVIDDLKRALVEAEAGEVEASIIILKRCDGYRTDHRSGVDGFAESIGRLEIIKAAWIADYFKADK